MWNRLFGDAPGLLLFVVWLALPPLYVLAVGRHYARRCRELYDLLRMHGCECDCCLVEEERQPGGGPMRGNGMDRSPHAVVAARAAEHAGSLRVWLSARRDGEATTAGPGLLDRLAAYLPRNRAGRHRQRDDGARTPVEQHGRAPAAISG